MTFYKQNRWITLILGVILVCFSAIILLFQEGAGGTGRGTALLPELQRKLFPPMPQPHRQNESPSVQNGKLAEGAVSKIKLSGVPLHTHRAYPLTSAAWTKLAPDGWIDSSPLKERTKAAPAPKVPSVSAAASPAIPSKAAAAKLAVSGAAAKSSAALPAKRTAKPVPAPNKGNTAKTVKTSITTPPLTLYFSRTQLLSKEQAAQAAWSYTVSKEDLLLLQKIVMAEAEGEPYEGKVAVANVVLNRLRSANFPDTIKEVIYQKRQFSPVANGRLKRVQPNKESVDAVNAALSGVKEVPDNTYFFLSLKLAQDLTVHHSQTYVATIGNHTFYK